MTVLNHFRGFTLALIILVSPTGWADTMPKIDLDVLYLGVMSDARTADFDTFLSERFARVETMDRAKFEPGVSDADFDVVLLDWHQGEDEFPGSKSYLGGWAELETPAVLLGSAGLLHATATEARGGFG